MFKRTSGEATDADSANLGYRPAQIDPETGQWETGAVPYRDPANGEVSYLVREQSGPDQFDEIEREHRAARDQGRVIAEKKRFEENVAQLAFEAEQRQAKREQQAWFKIYEATGEKRPVEPNEPPLSDEDILKLERDAGGLQVYDDLDDKRGTNYDPEELRKQLEQSYVAQLDAEHEDRREQAYLDGKGPDPLDEGPVPRPVDPGELRRELQRTVDPVRAEELRATISRMEAEESRRRRLIVRAGDEATLPAAVEQVAANAEHEQELAREQKRGADGVRASDKRLRQLGKEINRVHKERADFEKRHARLFPSAEAPRDEYQEQARVTQAEAIIRRVEDLRGGKAVKVDLNTLFEGNDKLAVIELLAEHYGFDLRERMDVIKPIKKAKHPGIAGREDHTIFSHPLYRLFARLPGIDGSQMEAMYFDARQEGFEDYALVVYRRQNKKGKGDRTYGVQLIHTKGPAYIGKEGHKKPSQTLLDATLLHNTASSRNTGAGLPELGVQARLIEEGSAARRGMDEHFAELARQQRDGEALAASMVAPRPPRQRDRRADQHASQAQLIEQAAEQHRATGLADRIPGYRAARIATETAMPEGGVASQEGQGVPVNVGTADSRPTDESPKAPPEPTELLQNEATSAIPPETSAEAPETSTDRVLAPVEDMRELGLQSLLDEPDPSARRLALRRLRDAWIAAGYVQDSPTADFNMVAAEGGSAGAIGSGLVEWLGAHNELFEGRQTRPQERQPEQSAEPDSNEREAVGEEDQAPVEPESEPEVVAPDQPAEATFAPEVATSEGPVVFGPENTPNVAATHERLLEVDSQERGLEALKLLRETLVPGWAEEHPDEAAELQEMIYDDAPELGIFDLPLERDAPERAAAERVINAIRREHQVLQIERYRRTLVDPDITVEQQDLQDMASALIRAGLADQRGGLLQEGSQVVVTDPELRASLSAILRRFNENITSNEQARQAAVRQERDRRTKISSEEE